MKRLRRALRGSAARRSQHADAVRIFKADRISSTTRAEGGFRRPTRFKLEDRFRNSFGTVRSSRKPIEVIAKFTGVVAALVEERVWHDSQKLEWLPAEDTPFEELRGEPHALLVTFRLSELVEFKR